MKREFIFLICANIISTKIAFGLPQLGVEKTESLAIGPTTHEPEESEVGTTIAGPDAIAQPSKCDPSPCGINGKCEIVNNRTVCSCLPNFIGVPPYCRPECDQDVDCPLNKICKEKKCVDPCQLSPCAPNANCKVLNHSAVCTCFAGFTGDPLIHCSGPNNSSRICKQPNTVLDKNSDGSEFCNCLPGFYADPDSWGCHPECEVHSDCISSEWCSSNNCTDPCLNYCDDNSKCKVIDHYPTCTCNPGYKDDPFLGCRNVSGEPSRIAPPCGEGDPVNSVCGPYSRCRAKNDVAVCFCLHRGTPPYCRQECDQDLDCPSNKICKENKCVNPCLDNSPCATTAKCAVHMHNPVCTCRQGFVGDPFDGCVLAGHLDSALCEGPNTVIEKKADGSESCNCLPGFYRDPGILGCHPICESHQDCPLNRWCSNNDCSDPCQNYCDDNSKCEVVNHLPLCTCNPGYKDDPFQGCKNVTDDEISMHISPCGEGRPPEQTACGKHSGCRAKIGEPNCFCYHRGTPPNCGSELEPVKNRNFEKCNPYSQNKICGANALCSIQNQAVSCTCPFGFTGNPLIQCTSVRQQELAVRPKCGDSELGCGANAVCNCIDGSCSCACLADFFGDPYQGCRPECNFNSDCPSSRSCIRNKCIDPCVDLCGTNAVCNVTDHAPICTCLPDFTGNPFTSCKHNNVPPVVRECISDNDCGWNKNCVNFKCIDPCVGTCGKNAKCRVVNHEVLCTCPSDLTGDPYVSCSNVNLSQINKTNGQKIKVPPQNPENFPQNSTASAAAPECTMNKDCPVDKGCVNSKCIDPCPGTCGVNAFCRVHNHLAHCYCLLEFTGDPFAMCHKLNTPTNQTEPTPSPKIVAI